MCRPLVLSILILGLPGVAVGQDTLPPVTVSVTRSPLPFAKTALAVQGLDKSDVSGGRPTMGLDEALAKVPGVFIANRYNFSLDQRIAIRGFGARSAFAVRGVKVLVDGIPQTLPDGQGQLTNLELGAVDRIEVLRGSASALYGNAAGGVISIWTDPHPRPEVRVAAGAFDRRLERTWTKWLATARTGPVSLTASRLTYDGARDHSAADFRNLGARLRLPLGPTWSLTALADVGDQPRADNPGALTLAELQANRDTAPALNVATRAGKDVFQAQGGFTLRRAGTSGEASVTLFGLTRDLENPQTFAYIRLGRAAYGARAVVTHGPVTAGVDLQRQRDDRTNFGNAGGSPDTVRSLDQLEHVTELGPFVQGVVDVTPHIAVTAGVRYDRVAFDVRDRLIGDSAANVKYRNDSGRRVMDALSGSLGATLQAAAGVTAYASIGSSFETPTTTELANRPDTAGGFNRDLDPQKAWTVEAGVRGGAGRGERGAGVTWDVAVYQADVRDELIGFEIATSPGRRFFRNAGSARHRGIEVGAGASLGVGVDLRVAWTYSDFRYRRYAFVTGTTTHVLDGRSLPGIPRNTLRLALRGARKGAWGELETLYTSGYLVNDTLSLTTSPWWATNLRFGWERGGGSGERVVRIAPFVAVQNLFNRKYVGSVVINAAGGRYYEPAPGRNVYLGLTVGAGR
jgi:iron complex outermembrane recepter protein